MDKYGNDLGIKAWAEEDRPREKFLLLGRQNLSDSELLAILLRSGSKNKSALDLAKEILNSLDNNLNRLAKMDLAELMRFKGMGAAKAITIMAALELGRRRKLIESSKKQQINSSKKAYDILAPILADLNHEEFWILLLNRNNRLIKKEKISKGGIAGTIVDQKIIFKSAIDVLASAIILCHNHPSGNLKPSRADITITRSLQKAAELFEIKILDHLIISEEGYFSFADESYL